jgi:hypothetical protein
MNTKCTLTDGSIYISIISIEKERIHKGQEPTFNSIAKRPACDQLRKKESLGGC